jgi:membrane-associated phospholipid phosphatase
MPDYLLQLDRHIFYFINHDLANPFFDWIMPWLRNPKFWIPLYLFIIGFSIYKYKKTGLVIILLLALTAGFADFTSASIVKHWVKRDRPCRDVVVSKTDIIRVACGTGYSFPSTHATDHFCNGLFPDHAVLQKMAMDLALGDLMGRHHQLCTGICRRTLPN